MTLLACLLLLASSPKMEVLEDAPTIARGKWNFYEINLRQKPATIEASYELQSGSPGVRLALMTRADAQRLFDEQPHGVLAATPPGTRGFLRFRIRRPDDYAIVVDNRRGERDAVVRVRASLDFSEARGPEVTRLSPERQLTVIALSFAFFFGVVTWSARRILGAIRK
jgi:hypothetical protein